MLNKQQLAELNTCVLVADFETTVWTEEEIEANGGVQDESEVWSAAYTVLGNEDEDLVVIDRDIKTFLKEVFAYTRKLKHSTKCYFQGLRFDGRFILYALEEMGYKLAISGNKKELYSPNLIRSEGFYTYLVTDRGEWFKVSVCVGSKVVKGRNQLLFVDFIDSCKLLPFKLSQLHEGFKTKHMKLSMDYTGASEGIKHKANGEISLLERRYIKHDVLVLSEALKCMFEMGLDKLTIGACCFSEFKNMFVEHYLGMIGFDELYKDKIYRNMFPNLVEIEGCNQNSHITQDDFVRNCYKGGLCYVNPKYAGKVIDKCGITLDNNSIYSYVMHTDNGQVGIVGNGCFPYGVGKYFADPDYYYKENGKLYQVDEERSGLKQFNDIKYKSGSDTYFFLHIRCSFRVKEDHMPFIRMSTYIDHKKSDVILDSRRLVGNEYYSELYSEEEGKVIRVDIRDLWLCEDDYDLFLEQYDVNDLEILEGYYYLTRTGMFDEYIDKWGSMKVESRESGNVVKGTIAKLMLNNLSGKFGTRPDNNMIAYIMSDDGRMLPKRVNGRTKDPIYVPISAVLTAKARKVLVRSIQKNYDRFLYCDTDSMHLIGCTKAKGIEIDKYKIGAWKVEKVWDSAKYLRVKCYALKKDEKYSVTCSGMSEHVKEFIECVMEGIEPEFTMEFDEFMFLSKNHGKGFDLIEYDVCIPGNLKQRAVKGGACLFRTDFKILRA